MTRSANATPTPKRRCQTITEKFEILQQIDSAERMHESRGCQEKIAAQWRISPSTVTIIKKNKEKIYQVMEVVGEGSNRKHLNRLNGAFPKVDERLALWHAHHCDTMQISHLCLRLKAMDFHQDLRE